VYKHYCRRFIDGVGKVAGGIGFGASRAQVEASSFDISRYVFFNRPYLILFKKMPIFFMFFSYLIQRLQCP
jgi:hypothetical protein